MSLLSKRFRGFLPVVVDVETGGFNDRTDALLQVAAVTLRMNDDGEIMRHETFSYHVKPFEGANMDPKSLEVNGIIDPFHPLRPALDEKDALDRLFKPIRAEIKEAGCNRAVLVGHNAHFDHGFMKAAVERSGVKRDPFHPFSSFDTVTLAGLALGQTVLARACQAAGIGWDSKEAHSATYDAEQTAELFCYIVNRYQDLGGWPLDVEQ
ncbi:MAG: ribonuclease T [Gammaproteobacteria bacterium]